MTGPPPESLAGGGGGEAPPGLEDQRGLWLPSPVGGSRRDFGAPRDIFPLPLVSEPLRWNGRPHGGRRQLQRVNRRCRVAERVNHTIDALNWCYGSTDLSAPVGPPTLAQQCAVDHLWKAHQEDVPPPNLPSVQAAVSELLGAPPSYGGDACMIAAFDETRVSIPVLGSRPTPLVDVLPLDARECLESFAEKMVLPKEELEAVLAEGVGKPFMDQRLKREPGLYDAFVKRMSESGLLRFGRSSKIQVAPFFVLKKNGSLRMILDCRPSNKVFRKPPHVRLGTCGEWAHLTLPPEDVLYAASGDIKDYFYACGIPVGLSEFFSLPPVKGSVFKGWGLELEGGAPADDEDVFPQLAVMPMGWSWAFFFAQEAHTALIKKYTNADDDDFLEAGRPPPHLRDSTARVHAYCDNLTVFGTDKDKVAERAKSAIDGLTLEGFPIHEIEEAASFAVSVGIEISGLKGLIATKPARRWKLRTVMEWLSARPRVSGKQVERCIGHSTFVFLLNRPLLSVFRNAYDFIQQHYHKPARLWGRAAEEFRHAAALITFAVADLRRPFSPTLHAFDASESGLGISASTAPPLLIEDTAGFNDRWRFREELYELRGARDNTDNFFTGAVTSAAFPEVSKEILEEGVWHDVVASPWKFVEPICMLEARAGLLVVRRLARSTQNFGRKHLVLGDSMGAILSYSKGRASDFRLLCMNRRIAALSVAANFKIHWRWLSSERNPSDQASRRFSDVVPPGASLCGAALRHGGKVPASDEPRNPSPARQAPADNCNQFASSTAKAKNAVSGVAGGHSQRSSSAPRPFGAEKETDCRKEESKSETAAPRGGCVQDYTLAGLAGRADSTGAEVPRATDQARLREPPGHLPRLLPQAQAGRRDARGLGHSGLRLLRLPVSAGRAGRLRDQVVSSLGASHARAGQGERQSLAETGESAQELAQICSDTYQRSATVAGHRRDRDADGAQQLLRGRAHGRPPVRHLHEVLGGPRASGRRGGEAGGEVRKNLSPLCGALEDRRVWRPDQRRSVRRCDPPRQQGSAGAGASSIPTCTEEAARRQDLHLQSRQVPSSLGPSGHRDWAAETSVRPSTPSWRGVARRTDEEENLPGDTAARPLALSGDPLPLREKREAAGRAEQDWRRHSEGLREIRPTSSTFAPRRFLGAESGNTSRRPRLCEFFSGSARLSKEFALQGWDAYAWDIADNIHNNILDPKVCAHLCMLIRSGFYDAVWLAPPCSSFSTARGQGPGPPALRSRRFPAGLPRLSEADRQKVLLGNSLAEATLILMIACRESDTPCFVENPQFSFIWNQPSWRTWQSSHSGQEAVTTFCAYGERWRKATKILSVCTSALSLGVCEGSKACCSFSGRPHITLKGRDPTGTWWTLRSQPYPRPLCREVFKQIASLTRGQINS